DVVIVIFSGIGAIIIVVASVGIISMPDFYLRFSVAVKASILGVGFVLLSTVLYFASIPVATMTLIIVLYLLFTSPVAAQLICRVAYFKGAKLWDGSVLDEVEDHYDVENNVLHGESIDKSDSELLSSD